MNVQPGSVRAFIDAARDVIARELSNIRREADQERALRDAEHRALMAELTAARDAVVETERRLSERLAAIKDGEPGRDGVDGQNGRDGSDVDMDQVRDIILQAVAALPLPKDGVDGQNGRDGADGKDGADADPETIRQLVSDAVAMIPAPENGRDGADGKDGKDGESVDPEAVRQMVVDAVSQIPLPKDGRDGVDGKDGLDGERGEAGPVGGLPVVVAWQDRVYYQGDVVSHDGAMWQAVSDTGRAPPHADWICLVERGADGRDGRSLTPRGLYDPAATYAELDIVTLNAGSFVARQDDPGECPGAGWYLLAGPGKRGRPGDRGEIGQRGLTGAAGEAVVSLTVNDEGVMTLVNGDGSLIQCDLYPVLAKIR